MPSTITIAINHQYEITANISVKDGLMNGSECCVKYIQPQQNNKTSQQQYGSNLKTQKLAKNNAKYINTFTQVIKSDKAGHQSLHTKGVS